MESRPVPPAVRVLAVNLTFGLLILIAIYVRHWIVLVLWFALLAAVLVPLATGGKGGGFAFFSILGWVVLGSAFGMIAGNWTWTGLLTMAIATANYVAYDWDRPLPPPSAPGDPAFEDPVFTAATLGLIVGGAFILLILTGVLPEEWLGLACGTSGFALAVLALAVARWQIST